jgi:seryl-tRNA synthetase
MLDIQYIRENPELVREKSKQKGYDVDIDQLLGFDGKRRELLAEVEALRRERNDIAEATKGQRPNDEQVARGRELKDKLANLEHELSAIEQEFIVLLKKVPNMPWDDVPVGESEDQNVVTKEWGEKPNFDFEPKNHWQIGEANGWIDKERAAKIAGSRFAYIKGGLAQLQFALVQFALQTLSDSSLIRRLVEENNLNISDKPFVPILPPAMIRTDAYEPTARLNAEETTYKLADDDLWLNASAEHSLCNMYMDEILDEKDLPIRYVGYATSFRREAGTYGKDMEGIIRMHQFNKVEMEVFSTPETGINEHLLLVAIQEHLMQQLGLPYRVLNKCTADIGGPNARGVDLDAWLAGNKRYLETHTADYMTDYQARRLKTRVRRQDGRVELLHMNDATAFSQRPMVAILEHYQRNDNQVTVPEVLRPYMAGKETI